jgi:zinc transporter
MSTSTESGLLHAFLLDGAGGARRLDWPGVQAWKPADGTLWLSLDYSIEDAKAWLAERSSIDSIVRDALLDTDPRPRATMHGNDLLLIIRGINRNPGAEPEDMISIRAWVEPHRIITMRHRVSRTLEGIAGDLENGTGPRDAAGIATALIEKVVERVAERVDVLGDDIAGYEDQVLSETRGELRSQLADHRRRAIALRRFLGPQREALAKLVQIAAPWIDTQHRARFAEAADRMTRTIEELDAARDRAAVTQEELSSRLTETTNQRLYILSIITAVFLPLGFVCSLLGVNVGGVPLQKEDWAFWALCGLFVAGVSVQILVFRKRGWFGRR